MFFSRVLRAADHPYLQGKGGRFENNNLKMQGLTMKSIKHHKALQPLFVIIAGGMLFVAAYVTRLATKTTDINWSKNKDPIGPMNYYSDRQFKMWNYSGFDYSKASADRPRYE